MSKLTKKKVDAWLKAALPVQPSPEDAKASLLKQTVPEEVADGTE